MNRITMGRSLAVACLLPAAILVVLEACSSTDAGAGADGLPGNEADTSDGRGARDAASGKGERPGNDGGTTSPANDAAPGDSGTDAAPSHERRFLCINGAGVDGAGGRDSGGNPWFEELCNGLGKGLVQACQGSTCYATFAFETVSNPSRNALIAALDTNHDGRVTPADTPFDLVLLGYSWGGTNVRDLANWMTTDEHFDAERRAVSRMIAIDPYRPGATMDIPANVGQFVEYRHSVAPSGDCSLITLGSVVVSGPYLGLTPRCKAPTVCTDYDYSLGGKTFFPGAFTPGKGYIGSAVDHCGVVNVAASAIKPLLAGTTFSPLPPTVPVATY
ncbi:hypothetical protein AKJ09_05705 [Labilithrix luteola]|uniref:Uncharacterized protein n=1 Tax=Labilithrix luteola TaxID=1391654 RepID=A0A0K1Q074_9BACT|nr:hypothetical protein [Labilithrix luteola]AKU99041.1 hypothetical protein AKJ09_05705 [Labilithrix luteola]